jgi:hypothetical protein
MNEQRRGGPAARKHCQAAHLLANSPAVSSAPGSALLSHNRKATALLPAPEAMTSCVRQQAGSLIIPCCRQLAP